MGSFADHLIAYIEGPCRQTDFRRRMVGFPEAELIAVWMAQGTRPVWHESDTPMRVKVADSLEEHFLNRAKAPFGAERSP